MSPLPRDKGHGQNRRCKGGVLVFMAFRARCVFSRLKGGPAPHCLNQATFGIEELEVDRRPRGHREEG